MTTPNPKYHHNLRDAIDAAMDRAIIMGRTEGDLDWLERFPQPESDEFYVIRRVSDGRWSRVRTGDEEWVENIEDADPYTSNDVEGETLIKPEVEQWCRCTRTPDGIRWEVVQ